MGGACRVEFALRNSVSAEMGFLTKYKTRPLNMQPPRLAAIAHGKLSTHVCPKSAASEHEVVQSYSQFVQPVQTTTTRPGVGLRCFCRCRISLFRSSRSRPLIEPARHKTSPREISTRLSRCPYCYGLEYDNRLESVANAHTAADLRVRPVLKPRWSYDRGRREQCRNTRCVATRNAFDSTSE